MRSSDLKHLSRAVRERNKDLLEPSIATAIKRNRKTDENDLQSEIIAHLQTLGYLVYHARPARVMRNGVETYETPAEGDTSGFPDIIAVGHDRALIFELKSEAGRVSDAQLEWLRSFMNVPGVTVMVVRPSNWNDLRSLL